MMLITVPGMVYRLLCLKRQRVVWTLVRPTYMDAMRQIVFGAWQFARKWVEIALLVLLTPPGAVILLDGEIVAYGEQAMVGF